MASPQLTPVIDSVQQLSPGSAALEPQEVQQEGELLNPQSGSMPQSNVAFEILPPDQLPNARPPRVSFAGLRDPKLRMVLPIPLDVTVEESTVVVSWQEIDEFGTGETLSTAIDDFASALRELYRQLFAPGTVLGADLKKVKDTIARHIYPRT